MFRRNGYNRLGLPHGDPFGARRGDSRLVGPWGWITVGLINGVGMALLRVQPLVMTLGTSLMAEGMLVVYSQKMMADAPRVPPFIEDLGAGKLFALIPSISSLGADRPRRHLHIGSHRIRPAALRHRETMPACQLSGIRVWRVLLVNYVLCSLLAATAGLVIVGSVDAADLSLADVFLLPSIAAVIIGGTSIFGGRGGCTGRSSAR